MKLHRHMILFLLPPEGETRLELRFVKGNKKIADFTNGQVTVEEQQIENVLQAWLYEKDMKVEFAEWYREAIDSAVGDPFYPAHRRLITKNICTFLSMVDPAYEVIIFEEEFDVNVVLE